MGLSDFKGKNILCLIIPIKDASASRDKLVEDVKVLTKDVQELLKATASVVGEKAAEARVKVEESLKVAQDKLSVAQEQVRAKGQEAFSSRMAMSAIIPGTRSASPPASVSFSALVSPPGPSSRRRDD